MRGLSYISLGLGLAATGTLALAVATDYWLYSSEPVDFEQMILQGHSELGEDNFPEAGLVEGLEEPFLMNESLPMILPNAVKLHSGLWRVCVYYEDSGEYYFFYFKTFLNWMGY